MRCNQLLPTDNRIADLNATLSWLGLEDWQYGSFFDPVAPPETDLTEALEELVLDAKLDEHPFFDLAARTQSALWLWASQELVMTNAFSQIVLRAASQIGNVHARAVLAEVAYGEHGRVRSGLAKRAHPWLLEQLRASIDLTRSKVAPAQPTINFIERLASRITEPLESVAFIGIGNERLIAPEYKAIRRCFQALFPLAQFEPFLKANIDEDIVHARLCYELGAILSKSSADEQRFLEAAAASIKSRVIYFDELLAIAEDDSS
jgi:hypothetical protein